MQIPERGCFSFGIQQYVKLSSVSSVDECSIVLDLVARERRPWDRSLPPPVAEAGRRSVGNRKERQYAASMRVPRVTMKPTLNCPGANTKENYLLSVVPLSQTITFTYFTLPLQETNPQPVYAGALSETI